MALEPLYIIAAIIHLVLALLGARKPMSDGFGRAIWACATCVGALFLMLSFWLYSDQLTAQLERRSWPQVTFDISNYNMFGGDFVVYTVMPTTPPSVAAFWTVECPGECELHTGTRITLYQDPMHKNNIARSNRVSQGVVSMVILSSLPTVAAWILMGGLAYIYSHDNTVAGVLGYDRPPPLRDPPEGYRQAEERQDSSSSLPPSYVEVPVEDE